MYKKVIKYTDLDGKPAETVAYFNFFEFEILEYQAEVRGGMQGFLQRLVETKDEATLLAMFKDLIRRTYGVRDADAFDKDPKHFEYFAKTPAYAALYLELATNDEAQQEFILGVLPESVRGTVAQKIQEELPVAQTKSELPPPPPGV